MSINVVCSHCESRLNLQDDLLGKQMRCPICREIFHVEQAPAVPIAPAAAGNESPPPPHPSTPRVDDVPPRYRSGSITDFLPLITAEATAPIEEVHEPPAMPTPKEIDWSVDLPEPGACRDSDQAPASAHPAAKTTAAANKTLSSKLPKATGAAPREVAWSDNVDPFAPEPVQSQPASREVQSASEKQNRRPSSTGAARPTRTGRKRSRLTLLLIMCGLMLGGIAVGGYFLKEYLDAAPERLITKAKLEYEKKNYDPARKLYDEFASDYPDDPRAVEARFFAELCKVRLAVYSLAVREDPSEALARLDQFLKTAESPEMKPLMEPNKFGVDVWETALKLTEETAAKARQQFNLDNPQVARNWYDRALSAGKIVERFHPPDLSATQENVFKQLEEFRDQLDKADRRLEYLADARRSLADPDDAAIAAVRRQGQERGLGNDPHLSQIISDAERKIADLAVYRRLAAPIPPVNEEVLPITSLLFAPRIDRQARRTDGGSTVFYAVARGLLYAMDENDGHVLWAMRTGIDNDTLPLAIPGSDLFPDLAIVMVNDGQRSSVCARMARTGKLYWSQPLPAPGVGPPVVVGQRLYVPLCDIVAAGRTEPTREDTGVILEYELANGSQIGRIVLGRTIGAPIVRRPGTGQIFIPAEARGVYVFDVDRTGPDGSRLDPAPVALLNTDQTPGTLRGEPIITPSEGDQNGYLVLGVTDGLQAMKLRAFPLVSSEKAAIAIGAPIDAVSLQGWTAYPPYVDPEKFAVVTDRGEFGLFGIRQMGNLDAPIFQLPPEPVDIAGNERPARGQVVFADESNCWVLARGGLRHFRIGFDAEKGLKLVRHGEPLPLGEPLHAPQVNSRRDTALIVTQTPSAGTCYATAVDLHTGELRWQRQLGVVVQEAMERVGDWIVILDSAAGLYSVNAKALAEAASRREWIIDDSWLVDRPILHVRSRHLLRSTDGKGVLAVVTAEDNGQPQLSVRKYEPGSAVLGKTMRLPSPLAGDPVIVGETIVLPLANGMLYRVVHRSERPIALEAGPTWRGDRAPLASLCRLTAIAKGEFVATDGAQSLNRWRWPADQDEFSRLGGISIGGKIAAPALYLDDADGGQLLIVDHEGNLALWAAAKLTPSAQPLQVWRAHEAGPVPAGRVTIAPFLGDGHIIYGVDGKILVFLIREKDGRWSVEHRWNSVTKLIGAPFPSGRNLLTTAQNGDYQEIDPTTGRSTAAVQMFGDAAPSAAAILLGDRQILAPLTNGTLHLMTLFPKSDPPLPSNR